MRIIIIGSGLAGMSAAAVLANQGHDVTILEKNDKPGGRINFFKAKGFTFDMGPSWYWMPEVFEQFYQKFGYKTEDFYKLHRLDPSYQVLFKDSELVELPASYDKVLALFDTYEPGSAERLNNFLDEAAYKYTVGMNEFVWKPSLSITEFFDIRLIKSAFKLQMLNSIKSSIKKVVKDERLRQILEFPVLFLGATAKNTPALYSLMNYADIKLGTWYPEGGMYQIANAFQTICEDQGVKFLFDKEVTSFEYDNKDIETVVTRDGNYSADVVISNADYNHIDQKVLPQEFQQYSKGYWDSRKLAPSSLLVFLGVDRKVPNLQHHNLFFDADFDLHAEEIYSNPQWPSDPLFYVCCPSKTDKSVAPANCENLFLLMPIATNLNDSAEQHEKYLDIMLARLKNRSGIDLKNHILYKKFFSVDDFKTTYNSFKGNAYGLSNTLLQTAFLKPRMKSSKLNNLYYAGQLTTPGPGLPPSIVSGQVVANEVLKRNKP